MSDSIVSPVAKDNLIAMRDFIRTHSHWAPSFSEVIELARLSQSLTLSHIAEEDYSQIFELVDSHNTRVLLTEIKGADPRVDTEFWGRFLQGDVSLKFLGRKESAPEECLQDELSYGACLPAFLRMLEDEDS